MSDLKAVYREMVTYFDPRPGPTKDHAALWLKEMEAYTPADVRAMLEHVKRDGQRLFPSINTCVAVADSLRHERQRQAHEARKRQEGEPRREPGESHGTEALRAMDDLFAGRITRVEYLHRCEALGHNMSKVKVYYAQWGDDLNGKPRGGMVKKEAVSV